MIWLSVIILKLGTKDWMVNSSVSWNLHQNIYSLHGTKQISSSDWPKIQYPKTNLNRTYQYMVAMLCMLYGEPYATHFPLSHMPLIYFYAYVGVSFNWKDILSENIKAAISAVTQEQPRKFPSFHMSSYLLDIMCTLRKKKDKV
jgi:hypothetical protein